MTDQHPINPPPELIEEWIETAKSSPVRPPNPNELATLAARWGADIELESCCEWLDGEIGAIDPNDLRDARRACSALAEHEPERPTRQEAKTLQLESNMRMDWVDY